MSINIVSENGTHAYMAGVAKKIVTSLPTLNDAFFSPQTPKNIPFFCRVQCYVKS